MEDLRICIQKPGHSRLVSGLVRNCASIVIGLSSSVRLPPPPPNPSCVLCQEYDHVPANCALAPLAHPSQLRPHQKYQLAQHTPSRLPSKLAEGPDAKIKELESLLQLLKN